MDNFSEKVIDFNKSKQKLLDRMYPNVKPIVPNTKMTNFAKTVKALNEFQSIFLQYQEDVNNGSKKIKLEEVLVYFNRFFEEAYKEFVDIYDLKRLSKFKESIDYAMLGGGKRLRPFLIYVMYNFCKGDVPEVLIPFMVAIEMIHTFSLIHDDLPAIDNDELRRGKETVWKKYGEDIAILTGDALLIEAATILIELIFEYVYTDYGTYVTTSALVLLKLTGLDGMIAGEVYDVINTNNKKLTTNDLEYMYNKKTSALLTASIVIGANMSTKYTSGVDLIDKLGYLIGESYQIKDDLLEIEGNETKIGKSISSDKNNGKTTFVDLVGVKAAKLRLEEFYIGSIKIIDRMTNDLNIKESKVLKEIVNFLLLREK